MNIANKLPTLNDAELTTLHANTRRLIDVGTPVQQSAGTALIPSIEAELNTRNAAKLSRRAEGLAARRAMKAAAAELRSVKPGDTPNDENP
jgi:hypothetical protein